MNELIIGDYGRFRFTISNKKHKIAMGFNLVGCVTDVDKLNIEITDNDDIIYIVKKKNIISFEPMKQPKKPEKL